MGYALLISICCSMADNCQNNCFTLCGHYYFNDHKLKLWFLIACFYEFSSWWRNSVTIFTLIKIQMKKIWEIHHILPNFRLFPLFYPPSFLFTLAAADTGMLLTELQYYRGGGTILEKIFDFYGIFYIIWLNLLNKYVNISHFLLQIVRNIGRAIY